MVRADHLLMWWYNANSTKFMLLIFSNLHFATTLEGVRSCRPILCLSQISKAPHIAMSTHKRRTYQTDIQWLASRCPLITGTIIFFFIFRLACTNLSANNDRHIYGLTWSRPPNTRFMCTPVTGTHWNVGSLRRL